MGSPPGAPGLAAPAAGAAVADRCSGRAGNAAGPGVVARDRATAGITGAAELAAGTTGSGAESASCAGGTAAEPAPAAGGTAAGTAATGTATAGAAAATQAAAATECVLAYGEQGRPGACCAARDRRADRPRGARRAAEAGTRSAEARVAAEA
ncbi:hypothetical protein GCM10023147_46640 [Tsukamurella soli]|uniref:Uncharacterized protein n=1 Tax=Tsukamurella soli TaxID=644556 RepID=A0ABP8KDU8_9ACTN